MAAVMVWVAATTRGPSSAASKCVLFPQREGLASLDEIVAGFFRTSGNARRRR